MVPIDGSEMNKIRQSWSNAARIADGRSFAVADYLELSIWVRLVFPIWWRNLIQMRL